MHNWRLLLLLFLAAFQPIASFTERNLVDGRDQCSEPPNQDHRLAHGPRSKLEERRLNHREEIRENRRNEIRLDRYMLERPSFERRLDNARSEIRARENILPRFERTDYRRESEFQLRDARKVSHGRGIQSALQTTKNDERNRENVRKRYTRNVQDDRVARETFNREYSQEIRREQRTRNSIDTRMVQDVVEKRGRVQETREARNLLQGARDDVAARLSERFDRRDFRERRITRERTADNRQSSTESRRYNDMERQTLDRVDGKLRRFESRSVDRIRDVREDNQMNRRNVPNERRSENSRQDDRRVYRRRQLDERASDLTMQLRRESTERDSIEHRGNLRARNVEDIRGRLQQRATRNNARRFQEQFRVNNVNKELRLNNRREVRSVRRDIRERQHLDVTREVKLTVRGSNDGANRLERVKLDPNTRIAASRGVFTSVEKGEHLQKSYINWQYLFYGLQAVYLCGILVQMLDRSGSGKMKSRSSWWNFPSQKLLKVD